MKLKTLPEAEHPTPFSFTDAYKLSHARQYPEGTTWVYSNLTPRKSRWPGVDHYVHFGLQAFLFKMNEVFHHNFFALSREVAVTEFQAFYLRFFGFVDMDLAGRVAALHDLGYLPLSISSLPEGSRVPCGVPVLTIFNTLPEFFWLTNFVESWLSAEIWQPSTSATTAYEFHKLLAKEANETNPEMAWFADYQGHDFSFRGMPGIEAARASGAAHLLSFKGTDTCPALGYIDRYYEGNPKETYGTSVPATEHSVMCAGGEESEGDTFDRLLDLYPTGILSIVSDTWDFWKVVTELIPARKERIMARDGKIVLRPDSSPKTPYEILCGDDDAEPGSPEYKGLIECLWDTFGGTVTSTGFKQLDSHIGAIYGDSITLDLAKKIMAGLRAKGFASTNVVLGIGSYTYQYVTRDTFGLAVKATAVGRGWGETGPDEIIPIFKDPKTDCGTKKSARGLLSVWRMGPSEYRLFQNLSEFDWATEDDDLRLVYSDGTIYTQTFEQIQKRLSSE